jgi:hypothetical protein
MFKVQRIIPITISDDTPLERLVIENFRDQTFTFKNEREARMFFAEQRQFPVEKLVLYNDDAIVDVFIPGQNNIKDIIGKDRKALLGFEEKDFLSLKETDGRIRFVLNTNSSEENAWDDVVNKISNYLLTMVHNNGIYTIESYFEISSHGEMFPFIHFSGIASGKPYHLVIHLTVEECKHLWETAWEKWETKIKEMAENINLIRPKEAILSDPKSFLLKSVIFNNKDDVLSLLETPLFSVEKLADFNVSGEAGKVTAVLCEPPFKEVIPNLSYHPKYTYDVLFNMDKDEIWKNDKFDKAKIRINKILFVNISEKNEILSLRDGINIMNLVSQLLCMQAINDYRVKDLHDLHIKV